MRIPIVFVGSAGLTFDERESSTPVATVTYCELRRGELCSITSFSTSREYSLCNAGNYLITEQKFDTFQRVLDYINNAESLDVKEAT